MSQSKKEEIEKALKKKEDKEKEKEGKDESQFDSLDVCRQVSGENVERLVQERRNSIALAMELHLSCTNLSIYVSQRLWK